jgi:hypothetical protein
LRRGRAGHGEQRSQAGGDEEAGEREHGAKFYVTGLKRRAVPADAVIMRRVLKPRSAAMLVVACFALAIAPSAVAASTDLINQIQQQVAPTGGQLPSDTGSLQNIANQIAASGQVPGSDATTIFNQLQAITANYAGADAQTVADILSTGLTPAQIGALRLTNTNAAYESALQQVASSVPADAQPTGSQLRPLTDAMRGLSGPSDATSLLTSLANQIDAVGGGVVPQNLLDQLSAVLRLIGSTVTDCTTIPPGPNCPLAAVLRLLLPPAARSNAGTGTSVTTPGTTPVVLPTIVPFNLVLKVAKIKLARNRKTAAVTLRSSVPAPSLPVGFATVLGRKSAAKPVLLNLATGKNVTKKVKLTRAATKTLKKKGGTLKVVPAFALPGLSSVPGVTLAETAKSLKVRKPRAHRGRR